jgi:hypothetical protein
MNRSKRMVLPPMDGTWFQRVFGFEEQEGERGDYDATQRRLQQMQLPGNETILKRSDGTLLHCGLFELPTLPEMRQQCRELLTRVNKEQQQQASSRTTSNGTTKKLPTTHPHDILFGPIRAANMIVDAYSLHAYPDAAGSIIQAASQFNCLEFPSPSVIPEKGITNYCFDRTQGPACAIACGAGTAYRNYLTKVVVDDNGATTIGQRRHSQINTLDDILTTLQSYRPDRKQPIQVRNGYANAKSSSLDEWNVVIRQHADELRNLLKVGIQRHTQVTSLLPDQEVLVTQLYCSAIPVAYSQASDRAWEPMARLVLEGCYEITLLAGVREALEKALAAVTAPPPGQSSESPVPPTRVFLTLVGGGVFGNDLEWIWSAIDRAFRIVTDDYGVALEVTFVHYSETPPEAADFVQKWNHRSNSDNATCAAQP